MEKLKGLLVSNQSVFSMFKFVNLSSGTTSFASENKNLATKIPLFFSVSVVESIAKLVPLSMVPTYLAGIIISLCDGIVTFFLSDKPQTIYKNTCAAMGQTFLDQDIIPIGNFPRIESECEEAIPEQFQVILDRGQKQLV
jgi:hypothetical protein